MHLKQFSLDYVYKMYQYIRWNNYNFYSFLFKFCVVKKSLDRLITLPLFREPIGSL